MSSHDNPILVRLRFDFSIEELSAVTPRELALFKKEDLEVWVENFDNIAYGGEDYFTLSQRVLARRVIRKLLGLT